MYKVVDTNILQNIASRCFQVSVVDHFSAFIGLNTCELFNTSVYLYLATNSLPKLLLMLHIFLHADSYYRVEAVSQMF